LQSCANSIDVEMAFSLIGPRAFPILSHPHIYETNENPSPYFCEENIQWRSHNHDHDYPY
jgi:hypothetical protein